MCETVFYRLTQTFLPSVTFCSGGLRISCGQPTFFLAMVQCRRCNQTASWKCGLVLCGHCCVPPCDENAHGGRKIPRGAEGKPRRARISNIWHETEQLLEEWFHDPHHTHQVEQMGISAAEARRIVLRDLNRIVREPSLHYDDDSLHILLVSTIPPGVVWRCVDRLREQCRMALPPSTGSEASESASSSAVKPETPRPAPRTPLRPPARSVPSAEGVAASSSSAVAAEPDSPSEASQPFVDVAWLELPLPPGVSFCLPERSFESKKALDDRGQECAHYRRAIPPFTGVRLVREIYDSSPEAVFYLGEAILRQWMFQRPIVQVNIMPGMLVDYHWRAETDGPGLLELHHKVGRWMWFQLKTWRPAPPEGTDVQVETQHGQLLTEAVHASSMYTLASAVSHGLLPGKEPGKGGATGVYAYRRARQRYATSSSGYAVYSDLAGKGIYFSPRIRLLYQGWRAGEPGVGKISAGEGQLRLTPGMFYMTGFWVHMVTHREVSEVTDGRLWFTADEWHPEYEIAASADSLVPTGAPPSS